MRRQPSRAGGRLRGLARIGRLAALLLVVSVLPGSRADASLRSGMGHLQALSGTEALPAGARVTVEPGPDDPQHGDDDPLYVAARAAVRRALATRGLPLGDGGALTFRIRIDLAESAASQRRPYGAFPGTSPVPQDAEEEPTIVDQVQVPFGRSGGRVPARMSIELDLFQGDKPPLWTATVTAADWTGSPEAIVRRLTAAAMGAFGDTAERDFLLSCGGETKAKDGLCLE